MKKLIEKVKNLVIKNKKISIISAALIIILVFVLIYFISAAGNSKPEETLEDKLRNHISAKVMAYVAIRYDTTGVNPRITTLRETSEGNWEVYGKVSARDTYGDSFTGTFEGTCKVESEEDFGCSLDYSNMYKDR